MKLDTNYILREKSPEEMPPHVTSHVVRPYQICNDDECFHNITYEKQLSSIPLFAKGDLAVNPKMPPHVTADVVRPYQVCNDDESFNNLSYEKPLSSGLLVGKRSPAIKRKMAVSFAPSPQVAEIEHLNEMEDIDHRWYSSEEYDAILADMQQTVRRMNYGCHINEETQCTVGLERFTFEGEPQFKLHVLCAVQAVFHEQNVQRTHGVNDISFLADISYQHSYKSQVDSHHRGLKHHQEVVQMELEESYLSAMIAELAFFPI